MKPGTILVFLEPLYKGGLDGVTPGSSCIVNAYTSNHDVIAAKETGALKGFALHVVDARRARPRPAAANPGTAAADQDAGVERALIGVVVAARRNPLPCAGRAAALGPAVRRPAGMRSSLAGAGAKRADQCAKVFVRKGR